MKYEYATTTELFIILPTVAVTKQDGRWYLIVSWFRSAVTIQF